jgi:hypothetical protein
MLHRYYARIQSLQIIRATLHPSLASAASVIFMASLVRLGWYLDIESLKSSGLGIEIMLFHAGLCFVMSGISLWLSPACQNPNFALGWRRIRNRKDIENLQNIKIFCLLLSRLSALAVGIFGFLTLLQHLCGGNLRMDGLLFHPASGVMGLDQEQMGFRTIALDVLIEKTDFHCDWYAQMLALS